MLEPQSTALFILLMVVFCALLAWVAVSKQPVFRVLAASLAFIPAMLFGVAAVNKYYDYYQTWGSVAADLGAQGVSNGPAVAGNVSGPGLAAILGKVTGGKAAARQGETVRFTLTGRLSHLTRTVYVFLPPQYFQAGFRRFHFPAIELIPGFPGQPQDWINVVGIIQTYETLLRDGAAKPAVLVMPDANGGPQISLQCLNVPHGPQDATFLAVDVPRYLVRTLRLQPQGQAWGIAGYSEGGFCTANLALNHPARYGYAAVLSGYFRPLENQVGNPPHLVSPFGKNIKLRRMNTPLTRVRQLPVNIRIPTFWLGAGSSDQPDVNRARKFQQALLTRQPDVIFDVAPGGSHSMATWRALVPPLLDWMTPRLAKAALQHPAPLVQNAKTGQKTQVRPAPPGGTTLGRPRHPA